ncbi:DUF1214 domain-containing protein [Bacillus sp. 123MFChir2]|uniref:DUF1214 domain-containing protein n=1 Tax=Bacillus sp. 123MFChir2 TaxID=1169144 RepID=UPI000381B57C|nr:DUF1214 domain-containing protein [Bacillus sp. 123MFChir2]
MLVFQFVSIYLWLSIVSNKGEESNWLPVPKGNFNLVMRYYQPNFRILNGSYQTPPVKKVRYIFLTK